jgi:hypothetical protein
MTIAPSHHKPTLMLKRREDLKFSMNSTGKPNNTQKRRIEMKLIMNKIKANALSNQIWKSKKYYNRQERRKK